MKKFEETELTISPEAERILRDYDMISDADGQASIVYPESTPPGMLHALKRHLEKNQIDNIRAVVRVITKPTPGTLSPKRIKVERLELARKIFDSIKRFEELTQTEVRGIDIMRQATIGSKSQKLALIEIETVIP